MVAMAKKISASLSDKEREKFDNITYDQIEDMDNVTEMRRLEQYMREEGFLQTADTVKTRMLGLGATVADGTDPASAKAREEELYKFRAGLGDFLADMSKKDEKLVDIKKSGKASKVPLPVRRPAGAADQEHRAPIATTKKAEPKIKELPPALAKPGDTRSGRDYFDSWDKFADSEVAKLDKEKEEEDRKAEAQLAGLEKEAMDEELKKVTGPGSEIEKKFIKMSRGRTEPELAWLAEREKEKGNEHFKGKEYSAAVDAYALALRLSPRSAPIHANRAAAYLKLRRWEDAEQDATWALDIQPGYTKALIRRGAARIEIGHGRAAVEDLEDAQMAQPDNSEVASLLSKAHKIANKEEVRKDEPKMKRMAIEEDSDESDDEEELEIKKKPPANAAVMTQKGPFVSCAKFVGAKKGYVFQMGEKGLGYYEDAHQKKPAAPAKAAAKATEPAEKGGAKPKLTDMMTVTDMTDTTTVPGGAAAGKKAAAAVPPSPGAKAGGGRRKIAIEEDSSDDEEEVEVKEPAAAVPPSPGGKAGGGRRKIAIEEDSSDDEEEVEVKEPAAAVPPSPAAKAGGGRRKIAIEEDSDSEEEAEPADGATARTAANAAAAAKEKAATGATAAARKAEEAATKKKVLEAEMAAMKEKAENAVAEKKAAAEAAARKKAEAEAAVADTAKEKGNAYFKAGDFRKAIAMYDQVIGFRPRDAPVLTNRALAKIRVGNWKGAEQDADAAAKSDPTFWKAYHRRGVARKELKKYKEAKEDLLVVRREMGDVPGLKEEIAAIQEKLDGVVFIPKRSGKMVIEEVADDDDEEEEEAPPPRTEPAKANAAPKKAEPKAKGGDDKNAPFSFKAGEEAKKAKKAAEPPKPKEAKKAPAAAKATADRKVPTNPAELKKDVMEQATDKVEADAVKDAEEAEAARLDGNDLYKQGLYKDAEACYSKSILKRPGVAAVYGNRSMVRLQLSNWAGAAEDASRAIAIDAKFVKGYHRRAQARAKLGHLKFALEDFKKVSEAMPKNEEVKAEIARLEKEIAEGGGGSSPPPPAKPVASEGHQSSSSAAAATGGRRKVEIEEESDSSDDDEGGVGTGAAGGGGAGAAAKAGGSGGGGGAAGGRRKIAIEEESDSSDDDDEGGAGAAVPPTPAPAKAGGKSRKIAIEEDSEDDEDLEEAAPPVPKAAVATTPSQKATSPGSRPLSGVPKTQSEVKAKAAAAMAKLERSATAASQPAPRSALDFERSCKALKGDGAALLAYVRQVGASNFAGVFKDALSAGIIAAVAGVARDGMLAGGDAAGAAEALAALSGVKRFEMNVMLLPKSAKGVIKEVIEGVEGAGVDAAVLRKAYKV